MQKELLGATGKQLMANPRGNPNLKPRWKKGESGNPSGKSAVYWEVTRLAQDKSLEAIETLHAIMTDDEQNPRNRIAAATAILDRALGKPQTHLNLTHEDLPVEELSDAEINERVLQILEKLDDQATGKRSKADGDEDEETLH